jgi:hypothetical protein
MSDEIPKTAEEYLRNKYGAYRGSFSWRDEESAFNAGVRSAPHALKAKLESAESRIKELESQLERKNVLLEATLKILKKLDDASGVESVFYQTAFYDDAECDGMCLAEDISTNLDFYDFDDYKVKEHGK